MPRDAALHGGVAERCRPLVVTALQSRFTADDNSPPAHDTCHLLNHVCLALNAEGVENDEEGIRTMRVLGENMAWVLKRLV
jgi:hypothetical protein